MMLVNAIISKKQFTQYKTRNQTKIIKINISKQLTLHLSC